MFDLSNKTALVTAAGHGLGRQFCEALAEYGADVCCVDINPVSAQSTVDHIKEFGHEAIAIEADVSKPDQVEKMIRETVAALGTIDILFSNAGIGAPPGKLHELAIHDWEKVLAVNLTGMFLCMRAALPIMVRQGRGSIVCTASTAGMVARGISTPAYGASKAGVIGLVKHAAVAYAEDNIRVNSIVPGGHETWPIGFSHKEIEQINKQMSQLIPLGRLGKPGEIKGLAVYLASDASSYVTGQTFVQDGGFTA